MKGGKAWSSSIGNSGMQIEIDVASFLRKYIRRARWIERRRRHRIKMELQALQLAGHFSPGSSASSGARGVVLERAPYPVSFVKRVNLH